MLEDEIVQDLGGKLRQLGFKKKSLTWRRETDEGIEVFNLERAPAGSAVFINVGLYIGEKPEPFAHDCGSARVEHVGLEADDVYAEVMAAFAKRRDEVRARQAPETARPQRVRHAQLGAGEAVPADGDNLRVTFTNGTTHVIKRAFLAFED